MSVKKRGLGRGLDALLGSASAQGSEHESADVLKELPVDQLVAGKHQPRRHFDEAALAELAESIKAQGVVQPIVVRAIGQARYEIVAGERRWRAAQLASLETVPVIVRELDERAAMALALVENIQRADLNALEEAEALKKLIDECGLTHEACAAAVGKSRATISNLLRLADLEPEAQQMLRRGELSFGHAKVLLGIETGRQLPLARQVVARQLSVRQLESLVLAAPKSFRGTAKPVTVPESQTVERELAKKWGLTIKLRQSDQGAGTLTLAFKTQAELDGVLAALR